ASVGQAQHGASSRLSDLSTRFYKGSGMGLSVKPSRRKSDDVARVDAEIDALKARLAALEVGVPEENGSGSVQSRRDWLKLAAAAAAGAAGSIVLRGMPAGATS